MAQGSPADLAYLMPRASDANLAQTRRLLGQDTYDRAGDATFSTCWTDDPRRAIAITSPTL